MSGNETIQSKTTFYQCYSSPIGTTIPYISCLTISPVVELTICAFLELQEGVPEKEIIAVIETVRRAIQSRANTVILPERLFVHVSYKYIDIVHKILQPDFLPCNKSSYLAMYRIVICFKGTNLLDEPITCILRAASILMAYQWVS